MPTIRPRADLRNNYNEISQFCHSHNEPVYITKNGKGDLAVLSIDTYEQFCGKFELRRLLEEGLAAEESGWLCPFSDAISNIRKELE